MKILITGASGFIGAAVCRQLISENQNVLPVYRNTHSSGLKIENINGSTNWNSALSNITHVIHTAARTHIMRDNVTDPLSEFRKVNVGGTLNLARQAADSGVTRFIFISSVKVNGEQTKTGTAFAEEDVSGSDDPYAISKYEAEEGLRCISSETNMKTVIIRPPLVYGPGVKANYLSLMKLIRTGLPLPFGSINNRRSMVSLDNLIDFIIICIAHPEAANQTFLVSDGEDLSVTQLLRRLASAMDMSSLLIPIPSTWLQLGLSIVGMKTIANRLCGSLQVDITKAQTLLGWSPKSSVDAGLKKTAMFFLENSSK
jgi:nucleoside-diphosphate-sugar epimerase